MLDLRREDGIALIVVLGLMLVFTITTVTAVNMATSTTQSEQLSQGTQTAIANAEAGVNDAESMLYYQNTSSGNPSSPTLLGCGTGSLGASDCTSYTPLTFCMSGSTCTGGNAGSAKVYGFFSGTNSGSYNGISLPPSTWLVMSTGYAAGPGGVLVSHTVKATIKISALGSGAVASVWNHVFLTAPLVAGQCQLNLSGNGVTIDVPLYVTGNVCLGGNSIIQPDSSHPVDVMIGGSLALSSGFVGSSTSAIYSGVVQGGCTLGALGSTTTSCGPSTHWYAGKTDTWQSQDAPAKTSAEINSDYSTFDPGPEHPCKSNTSPSPPTGGTVNGSGSVFDSTVSPNEGSTVAPDTSGSVVDRASFELAPSGSSYACLSSTGSSYLIWNGTGSSFFVSGPNITVPAGTLAVNGSIFFDSNVTISNSFVYQGTGIIEASGTITLQGNNKMWCAVSPVAYPCNTSWQGTSGNNSMLTLASLASNTTGAITFHDNHEAWQGSLWTQPSSSLNIVQNTTAIQGPMSIGSFSSGFNGASLNPLPVIENMPTGAPLPPNTSVNIGAPTYLN